MPVDTTFPYYSDVGERQDLPSIVLERIYRLTHAPDTRSVRAEVAASLGFAVLAVSTLASGPLGEKLLGRARSRVIATGYDSGDLVMLGELTKTGFTRDCRIVE